MQEARRLSSPPRFHPLAITQRSIIGHPPKSITNTGYRRLRNTLYGSSHDIDHRLTNLQFGPRDVTRHSKIPLFFKIHGSVLPKILLPLCMVTIWATANTLIIREIEFDKTRMAQPMLCVETLPDILQTNWIRYCSPSLASSSGSLYHSETPPHTRDTMKVVGHGPI